MLRCIRTGRNGMTGGVGRAGNADIAGFFLAARGARRPRRPNARANPRHPTCSPNNRRCPRFLRVFCALAWGGFDECANPGKTSPKKPPTPPRLQNETPPGELAALTAAQAPALVLCARQWCGCPEDVVQEAFC